MSRTCGRSDSKTRNLKQKKLVPILLSWFAQNARSLPWRRTRDPYAIWISEIMLQQTQVKTVIPYWRRWMRELPTVQSLSHARRERVLKLWEGLGYYTRANNLQKAARTIVDRHGGRFPEKYDDLVALPGIGRYTAGAVLSIAFNQPAPVLDGNVIRVLTRLFGIAENPREKKTGATLWALAETLVREAATLSPAHEPSRLRVADPRSGPRLCEAQRFMVPMRAQKRKEAFHEPRLHRDNCLLQVQHRIVLASSWFRCAIVKPEEHPTSNIEWQRESSLTAAFEVRCWTFDVFRRSRVSTREFHFAEPLPIGWGEGQGEGPSEILQTGLDSLPLTHYRTDSGIGVEVPGA